MNFKPQHYFQISLTGNVFAVPTAFSAGPIGSDQFLEVGYWSNQYDVTIYCDVKVDWRSVLVVPWSLWAWQGYPRLDPDPVLCLCSDLVHFFRM